MNKITAYAAKVVSLTLCLSYLRYYFNTNWVASVSVSFTCIVWALTEFLEAEHKESGDRI